METCATSLSHLVRDISKASSRREESETDYHDLLRKIFDNGGVYDSGTSQVDVDQLAIREAKKSFGREHVKQLVLRCLDPQEVRIQLCAISIVGAAGIGKTDFTRLIYEHGLVQEHFEVRVWVKADGHEFNLHHAAQQILKSTMGMAPAVDDLGELDEMVRDTVQWRKCLIVLDGVESMNENMWLHMNTYWFYLVDMGSMVLMTTRSVDVANIVSNDSFELNQLLPDDGWSLYQHLAFGSSYMVEKEDAWSNLGALCGHVPLLLKLVGSMRRYDDNLLSSVDFSDAIFLPKFDPSVAILLCVWALPPQLRKCLAFCAVFPKGYDLDREKIINLWAAHGLLETSPKDNTRDIGDSYFHLLLCRSFFTDIARNEYGDITEFRMPGLIHKIMQDVAAILLKGKVGLIVSVSEDADLLSLHSESAFHADVTALILSSTLHSDTSLEYSVLYFQELRSLDLSYSGIRNLSDDVCALTELRYVNLSYTLIERLPDSFTELSQLQSLDLSWCYHFKALPKAMRDLTYMSHLDLSKCESLSSLPSGIGLLKSLTSMPLFVLGKDHGSARLGELGLLKELRGRLEIRNLENVIETSDAHDAKLNQKKLKHLVLSWSKDVGDCFEILKLLKPNRRLKVLDITGFMGSSFPLWLSSINSLMKINITDCACKKLPSLGQMPYLKELQLNRMMNLECIGQEFYGDGFSDVFFPSLEQLELCDLPRLLEWSGARVSIHSDLARLCCSGASSNSVFRSLKTLTIYGCPKLPSLPSLPTLPDLILKYSSNTVIYSLTSFTSLSSLLIDGMEVGPGVPFGDLGRWESLKKLVLCNIRDKRLRFYKQQSLTALEHLVVIHCHELTTKRSLFNEGV